MYNYSILIHIGGNMKTKDKLLAEFRKKIVMSLNELMELFNCSPATVHRYLNKWGSFNSLNFNSRYYVLKDIPVFDEFGIWIYNGISFSKYGNLTKTIIGLIDNSKSGMNASEISERIASGAHTILTRLTEKGLLIRLKKPGGYMYFSSDPNIRKEQEQYINYRESSFTAHLSLEKAIAVLIEKIRNPELEPAQLAVLLRKRGVVVQETAISSFLSLHGLSKKK